ncbi:DUF3566 domain-containing protein [Cellulomonas sp. URHD0024]|uniref:DUF3566 domain-containing protein n=1 Tax=Cellulomonas sp. URHD0024 TaxID=1302620 RepID=UPI001E532116|nr:DUF3566 domain-containing protein [Cellulomonas sp. URHD0024]
MRTGSNAAWNGSDELDAPTSNGSSTGVGPPSVAPPVRTSTGGGRAAGGSGSGSSNGSSSNGSSSTGRTSGSAGTTKTSIRLGDGVTVPPEREPDQETSPADPSEDVVPSPMMVAVDATTAWFKKAGGATTAAFASLTRPRSEEPTMTANPAAAPAARPAPTRTSTTTENPRPSTGRIPTVSAHGGPRRVRLAISRVDPWSVMKLSLLVSVAIGIMFVVAVIVVWLTLDKMHVFAQINDLVTQITGQESTIDILQYVEFRRIVSGSMLIAVVDVFLLTALATIGAFLYNIVAALVGGVHVTMTDD